MPNFKGGREQEMMLPCALGEGQKFVVASTDAVAEFTAEET